MISHGPERDNSYCFNCGNNIELKSKFCSNCGQPALRIHGDKEEYLNEEPPAFQQNNREEHISSEPYSTKSNYLTPQSLAIVVGIFVILVIDWTISWGPATYAIEYRCTKYYTGKEFPGIGYYKSGDPINRGEDYVTSTFDKADANTLCKSLKRKGNLTFSGVGK